jgi:hypothetical protein
MSLDWSVGQAITATRLNRRLPIFAYKTADTARASTTTVTADPHLVFALKADTTYELRGRLTLYSASSTPDFKYNWAWTNSATMMISSWGLLTSVTITSGTIECYSYVPDTTSPSPEVPYAAVTSISSVMMNDLIIVGANDLTLTFQWAQNTSNATATSLKIGTSIEAIPVA